RRSKRARDGDFLERQIFRPIRNKQLWIFGRQTGNPISDVQTRGISAGQQCGPRWRTYRAGGIGLREFHPVTREPINVRRLVEVAAVTRQIGPAQIIGQDQDDVRWGRWSSVGKL